MNIKYVQAQIQVLLSYTNLIAICNEASYNMKYFQFKTNCPLANRCIGLELPSLSLTFIWGPLYDMDLFKLVHLVPPSCE